MAEKPVAHYTINDNGPRAYANGMLERPYYTITSGDNLTGIGERFGVSVAALEKANDLKPGDLIHPNQKLMIPGAGGPIDDRDKGASKHASGTFKEPNYTVGAQDTMWSIGTRFGVSVAAVKKANGLTSDVIRPNQKLVIPGTDSHFLAD
jgi:peptidoglycan endopeptidase LytE